MLRSPKRNLTPSALVAAALCLVPLTVFVPGAAADVCLNDTCVDVSALTGTVSACASVKYAVWAPWVYMVGGLQDPPSQLGTTYTATWFGNETKAVVGGHCQTTAVQCHMLISDGSEFQYLEQGSNKAFTGEYKSVPAIGGSLSCSAKDASLTANPALVLTVTGHNTRTATPLAAAST